MTVFVVTSGDYSEYRTDAIFSTRELAEQYTRDFPASDCNSIDEWELDSIGRPTGCGIWNVRLHFTGDTYDAAEIKAPNRRNAAGDVGRVVIWKRTEAPAWRGKVIDDLFCFSCWARDREHAIKIASEKLGEYLYANPERVPK